MKFSYYRFEARDLTGGPMTIFYEIGPGDEVTRQVEVDARGRGRCYDAEHPADEFGELAGPQHGHARYLASFSISRKDFDRAWLNISRRRD